MFDEIRIEFYHVCRYEILFEYCPQTDARSGSVYSITINLFDDELCSKYGLSNESFQLYQFLKKTVSKTDMESWMITSLVNCSDDLKQRKLEAVTIFRDSFLRYLSLNRLSFATGKVLSSQKYMVQMVTDFSRIDFEAIKREVVSF